jgi:hypothetical protein
VKKFRTILCTGFICFIFGLPVAQAAESASENECAFNPPQAVLQPKAYSNYTFTRKAQNRAIESATVRDNLHVEISLDQCVDIIVREITFIVPLKEGGEQSEQYWLQFAQAEIGRLKRNASDRDDRDMQQFLVLALNIGSRHGTRSSCKDGSMAEAGVCSWESMGGFIFEVKKDGSSVKVSVTEYSSA